MGFAFGAEAVHGVVFRVNAHVLFELILFFVEGAADGVAFGNGIFGGDAQMVEQFGDGQQRFDLGDLHKIILFHFDKNQK
jgi:hypothetical protein